VFLGCWQILSSTGLLNEQFASSPVRWLSEIEPQFSSLTFWKDIRTTFVEVVIGIGLSIAGAVPVGIVIGWFRRIRLFTNGLVSTFNALPYIALVPLIIIFFGIDTTSRVVIVIWGASITLLINTISGVQNVPSSYLMVSRAYCASRTWTLITVVFPASVPYILAGLKVGVGRGLVAAIVAEFFMGASGLGYFISKTANSFNMDAMFLGLVVLAIFGVALVAGTNMLERRFAHWSINE
jgi:ABC-type nitrate/sulfonate/bicarbonate transport system permease component